MKSINLIENKTKTKKNKIKEAFKKIGEYTLIAATAFSLSCGGVETDNHKNNEVNRLPSEGFQYASENDLNDTYDVLNHTQGELNSRPFLLSYQHFCSQSYSKPELVYEDDKETHIKLNKKANFPLEFYLKTLIISDELPNFVSSFENYDSEMVRLHFWEDARPPPGFSFYSLSREEFIPYRILSISVFNHVDNSEENIKTNKPPAFILCYLKYNNQKRKEYKAVGRAVVIPYDMFMDETTKYMTEKEIFENIN